MDNLNIIKNNTENMIIKVDNINAHPFNEFNLFINQTQRREETIKSLLKKYKTIKLVFTNNDYVLITPAFNKKYKFQRTYISRDNEPLGHMEYNSENELIRDTYIRYDLKHIEVKLQDRNNMKELNINVNMKELDVILSALDMFKDEEESEQSIFVGELFDKLAEIYN